MRSQMEPWERGMLCQLWHRAELIILDQRPRTPQHLLKEMARVVSDMQWEYKPTVTPGRVANPISDEEVIERINRVKNGIRFKGSSPGR